MTSTDLVRQEINRFLASPDPEVLCISGQWGIGKTFLWQSLLDQAVASKTLSLGRYSYVSLFGLNSLEGLKLNIFENIDFLVLPEQAKFIEKANVFLKKAKAALSKFKGLVLEIPHFGRIAKGMGPIFFSAIRNQIVCIDDFERASFQLRAVEILGLVSFLKEQRKCKIVILINDGKLFKDLGRMEQSVEMIKCYVDGRKEDAKFWDLKNHTFGNEVRDPDIVKAFETKLLSLTAAFNHDEILERIAADRGWHTDELAALSQLTAEHFYEFFTAYKGENLSKLISTILDFERMTGATEVMLTIAKNGKAALAKIASESPINARRLRNYGISSEDIQ